MKWLTASNATRLLLLSFVLAVLAAALIWAMPMMMTQSAQGDSEWDQEYEAHDGPHGIWVTATGEAVSKPDIAILDLGVESLETTAADARQNAAEAMSGLIDALTESGIAEADIQTSYFNVSPRYRTIEGRWPYNQELVGYAVTNQVTVKIRDLDSTGDVIDDAIAAAGDMIRIGGLQFSLDNPQALRDQALVNAVAELNREAAIIAEETGAVLGPMAHIQEQTSVPALGFARAESAALGGGSATTILGGEVSYTVEMEAIFLIAAPGAISPR